MAKFRLFLIDRDNRNHDLQVLNTDVACTIPQKGSSVNTPDGRWLTVDEVHHRYDEEGDGVVSVTQVYLTSGNQE